MAIVIDIVDGPTPVLDENENVIGAACSITMTDGAIVKVLNVGDLPASVLEAADPEAAALVIINERVDELWAVAQPPKPKTIASATQSEIIRALASLTMKEINILRRQHQLPERTQKQFLRALRNELNNL